MKKILFIFSQYRVCERILPVIPFLSEEYELDCLLVYQMKSSHQWPGDKDLREHFYNTYQFDFNFLTNLVPRVPETPNINAFFILSPVLSL